MSVKKRKSSGFTGSKGSVNHEAENNEKPWSQNKGKSNASSLCTVSSVNMSPSAYGNKAAFKKVKQKCFLCGQTGWAAQEWIYLSMSTKPRKTRKEKQRGWIFHQPVSLPNQHAPLSFLFLHVTRITKCASRCLYDADVMSFQSNTMCMTLQHNISCLFFHQTYCMNLNAYKKTQM